MAKFTLSRCLKVFLALILVAAISAGTACSKTAGAQTQHAKLATPAPNFILNDLSGSPIALSDFRGKPVFFNYWASWCPSCVKEMPIIQSAYQDWAKRGLVLITVNAGEDLATVQAFMQSNLYTFPVLLDSQNAVGDTYNIYAIPVSVFVDRQGNIKNKMVGPFADKSALDKQLAAIVNSP